MFSTDCARRRISYRRPRAWLMLSTARPHENAAEARKQVILADLAPSSRRAISRRGKRLERLTHRLQQLNPRASIDVAVAGVLDPNRIIERTPRENFGLRRRAQHWRRRRPFVSRLSTPDPCASFSRAMGDAHRVARARTCCASRGLLDVAGRPAGPGSWCSTFSTWPHPRSQLEDGGGSLLKHAQTPL